MSKILTALIKTIEDAKDSTLELAEYTIDLTTDSEILEEVPLVSLATKLLTIRDVYHINKIKRNYTALIKCLDIENYTKAQKLIALLEKDESLAEETAENIFEIVYNSEKTLKAELIGRLLSAVVEEKLSLEDYNTLVLMIHAASIPALLALPKYLDEVSNHSVSDGSEKFEGLLFSLGIVKRSGTRFDLEDLGMKLAERGFNIPIVRGRFSYRDKVQK